jgi:hypothetical protein
VAGLNAFLFLPFDNLCAHNGAATDPWQGRPRLDHRHEQSAPMARSTLITRQLGLPPWPVSSTHNQEVEP